MISLDMFPTWIIFFHAHPQVIYMYYICVKCIKVNEIKRISKSKTLINQLTSSQNFACCEVKP